MCLYTLLYIDGRLFLRKIIVSGIYTRTVYHALIIGQRISEKGGVLVTICWQSASTPTVIKAIYLSQMKISDFTCINRFLERTLKTIPQVRKSLYIIIMNGAIVFYRYDGRRVFVTQPHMHAWCVDLSQIKHFCLA